MSEKAHSERWHYHHDRPEANRATFQSYLASAKSRKEYQLQPFWAAQMEALAGLGFDDLIRRHR